MCLLPFEPAWFTQRRVPAVFVGHPLFDTHPEPKKADHADWPLPPNGRPKIALLPGSRPGEIQRNWPTMVRAFTLLRQKHPNLCGLVAASNPNAAQQVRHITETNSPGDRSWPDGLIVATAQTERVLDWADTALVVSGTATLLCAARRRPMVVIYNVGRCSWQLWGRWVVRTRTFALPNLITQADGLDPAVPEWVPHFGQVEPIADAVDQLTSDPEARNRQLSAFDHITQRFAGRSFVHTCTQQVFKAIR